VGLGGALFGRKKAQEPKGRALFALVTAQGALAQRLQMVHSGKAGLCFRPLTASSFADLERDVQGILSLGQGTAQTQHRVVADDFGFRWLLLQVEPFEELVSAVYQAAQTFAERGFQEQLLAVVFPFRYEGQEVHWIFSYRRGTFYPFIPVLGEAQRRDSALEVSLVEKVGADLPVEKELERWYPLWGAPFSAV
jgi:hypothetical protein